MAGQADAQMERAVAACLASGPADVLELLARLRRGHAALLGSQEGALHALLQAGIRTRRLTLAGRSKRGLAEYTLADKEEAAARGHDAAVHDDPPPIPDARGKVAIRIARAARDDADRARIFSDVSAHLEALEKVDARRRFGSPRLLRNLIRRADRGKGRVLFAHSAADKFKRLLIHEGPWIVGVVATYFLLRTFVLNVYVIPSGSMRTTLTVGDRVVVRRGGTPERWRIWVFETNKAIVKRIVGLGGETIAIYQGDVFLDDELVVKPESVREALRRPGRTWTAKDGTLLDWDRRALDDGGGDWTCRNWPSDGDVWIGNQRTAQHAPPVPLHDGYLDFDVERPATSDAGVVLSRGFLTTELYAQAVAWRLLVKPTGTSLVELREDGRLVELASDPDYAPSGRIRVSLAYVDGVLRAQVGTWTHVVAREAAYYRLQARLLTGPAATPIAVHFAPDVHYSADGEHGVSPSFRGPPRKTPYKIKPGEYFFLGDNTRNSEDSRAVGGIPGDALIGPVVWRLWPLGRVGTPR